MKVLTESRAHRHAHTFVNYELCLAGLANPKYLQMCYKIDWAFWKFQVGFTILTVYTITGITRAVLIRRISIFRPYIRYGYGTVRSKTV
jgi:hypothetical protein